MKFRRFQMKRYFGKIMVMALIAAFVFASFSYAQDETAPARQKQPGATVGGDWRNALNLTPDQETKLKAFREARQKESQDFREEMRKMQTELRDLTKDPKADLKKVDGLIDEMSKLRASRQKASFRNREEMKKIFTPEQLEKMQNVGGRLNRPGRMMGRGGFGMGMGMGRLQGIRPLVRQQLNRLGLMRRFGRNRGMRRRW
jgi:Spy/CpxP family protein refolding chaperone